MTAVETKEQPVVQEIDDSFFDDKEVIIECICEEPTSKDVNKKVLRKVWFMPLTMDNLAILWEKVKLHRALFNEEIRGDFEKFVNVFFHQVGDEPEASGLVWVLDDFVGMFYMTRIVRNNDALVHFTFFDGRLKGRLELTRKMLKYGFDNFNFRRFSVEIGMFAKPVVRRFVENIGGFRSEGRKKSVVVYMNTWYDLQLYSVFKQDLMRNE